MKLRIALNGMGGELGAVVADVGELPGIDMSYVVDLVREESGMEWELHAGDTITITEVEE